MADRAPTGPEYSGTFPPFGFAWPFPFGFALPFLWSLYVLPLLGWQRAMLQAYQKVLEEGEWAKLSEEEAKRGANLLLKIYLELSKSRSEMGEQVVAWQSDLVRGYLGMLEGVWASLERKPMA